MRYYISIEKNNEAFEFYRALWKERGIDGIRADNMTEGIKKAIELEKTKRDELYFIDIVANDIDYMPQLQILGAETNAPILIATCNYNEAEHHEALNNGADFFGGYCDTPEQNINGVIASVNSIDRRIKKKKPPSQVFIYNNLLLCAKTHQVFHKNKQVVLTKKEFDLLHYFMANKGATLSYEQIYNAIWDDEYNYDSKEIFHSLVRRLRMKLQQDPGDDDYITSIREVGYRFGEI